MQKKSFIAILALLVFGIAVMSITQPTNPVGPRVVEVVFTRDGFSPTDVQIREGDSVRFINNSSRPFWPASAAHPTHTLYPEHSDSDCLGSSFDACAALPPGESWQFTFTHIGEWSYHDHLNAGNIGFVTVTR